MYVLSLRASGSAQCLGAEVWVVLDDNRVDSALKAIAKVEIVIQSANISAGMLSCDGAHC